MDSVYPEPLSVLYKRAVRKKVHRGSGGRYRTQPVTFSEIQEVDEENADDSERSAAAASKSELDLKAKFEEFKRKRDQDVRDSRLAIQPDCTTGQHGDPALAPRRASNTEGLRSGNSRTPLVSPPILSLRASTHQRPSI